MAIRITYRGIDRVGAGVGGTVEVESVSDFVRGMYKRGFRELAVYRPGHEDKIGEILTDAWLRTRSKRVWWSE